MRRLPLAAWLPLILSMACVGGVKGASDAGPGPGPRPGPSEGEGEVNPPEGEGEVDPPDPVDAGPEIVDIGGFPKPDASPNPEGTNFGQPCSAMGDCKSGLCVAMGNFILCSRTCDPESLCPPCAQQSLAKWSCRQTDLVDGQRGEVCFYDGNICPER